MGALHLPVVQGSPVPSTLDSTEHCWMQQQASPNPWLITHLTVTKAARQARSPRPGQSALSSIFYIPSGGSGSPSCLESTQAQVSPRKVTKHPDPFLEGASRRGPGHDLFSGRHCDWSGGPAPRRRNPPPSLPEGVLDDQQVSTGG